MRIFAFFIYFLVIPVHSFADSIEISKFANINDLKIEYIDIGKGDINIVIESGIGTGVSYWLPLLSKLESLQQHIIIYSRAGNGKSSSSSDISIEQSNKRLHTLLEALDSNKNLVLVGHSYGGLHVRQYAATYQNKIIGLVLLDPSHEKFSKKLNELNKSWAKKDNDKLNIMMAKSPEWKVLQGVYENQQLADNGSIREVPTVIVTSSRLGESDWWIGHSNQGKAIWRNLHASLIEKNPNSVHIVSNLTGHNIPLDAPDMVVDAISQTIDLVKNLRERASR